VAAHRFETVLQAEEGGPAVFVEVPDDVRDRLGSKRAPVRGTINGTPFRSTIAVYGARGLIPVPRRLRERAGIAPGEGLVVELERDDEPREAALAADEEARAAFTKLSYSHRKEYVAWIEEAVRAETRRRRIERTVGELREGSR
jgi:bifunctional DNA-binding transcriptional regulator/antitoxin component of YhaV-PrlF toxin-antitoxin module